MDAKKRRSSLRKTDDASEVTCRLKRRISFSGKKAVREFSKEEEAKIWNHSYEVSDHTNGDEASSLLSIKNRKRNTVTKSEDKTNKESGILAHNITNENCTVAHNLQPINGIPQQKSSVHFDNSIDITLFEHEKRKQAKNSAILTVSGDEYQDYSYSLIEQEREALLRSRKSLEAFECTSDYIYELSAKEKKRINLGMMEQKNVHRTVLFNDEIQECTNDCGDLIGQRKSNENCIYVPVDMDVSVQNEVNKENINTPNISFTKCEKKCTEGFEKKLQNLSLHMESDESVNYEKNLKTILRKAVQCEEKKAAIPIEQIVHQKQNATIVFDEDINYDISCVHDLNKPTGIKTNKIKGTNDKENKTIGEMLKCRPKVVVVHKFCPKKEQLVNDYVSNENQEQFQLNSEQKCITQSLSQDPDNEGTLHNSMCYSPDPSSPLLPPELITYSNKKLNFRQINDDIEHGRIQVFRDAQRTPLTGCKANRLQFLNINNDSKFVDKNNEITKVRGTLFFDDVIYPTEENEMTLIEKKSTMDHNYQSRNRNFRFSQAGEMLLNNTNFLTQARLGDETVSCNSSKSSISSKRDTIYFDVDIPCEIDEKNKEQFYTSNTRHHEKNLSEVANDCTQLNNDLEEFNIEVETSLNDPQKNHLADELCNEMQSQKSVNGKQSSPLFDDRLQSQYTGNICAASINAKQVNIKQIENKSTSSHTLGNEKTIKFNKTVNKLNICQKDESVVDKNVNVQFNEHCNDASQFSLILNEKLDVRVFDKKKDVKGSYENKKIEDIDKYFENSKNSSQTNLHNVHVLDKTNNTFSSLTNKNINNTCYQSISDAVKNSFIPRRTALFNETIEIEAESENLKIDTSIIATIPNTKQCETKFTSSFPSADSMEIELPEPPSSLLEKNQMKAIRSFKEADGNIVKFNKTKSEPQLHYTELITPRRNVRSSFSDCTPHRSLIEFEKLERKCGDSCSLTEFCNNDNSVNTLIRSSRRITNIVPCNIDLDESEIEQMIESKKTQTLPRLTNIEPCNIEFEKTIHSKNNTEEKIQKQNYEQLIASQEHEQSVKEAGKNCTINDNVTIIEDLECIENNLKSKEDISARTNDTSIVVSFKRLPFNLTPVLPTAKKRQTVVFEDRNLSVDDKSVLNNFDSRPSELKLNFKRHTQLFSEKIQTEHKTDLEEEFNESTQERCDITNRIDVPIVEDMQQDVTLTKHYNEDVKKDQEGFKNISTTLVEVKPSTATAICDIPKNHSLDYLSNINCSLETIEIPRRATTIIQRKISCSDVLPSVPLTSKKNLFESELTDSVTHKDAITISDVSVFYQEQQAKILPNNTDGNLIDNNEQLSPNQTGQAFDKELQNVSLFKKKCINCTSDSLLLTLEEVDWDEIDKTRISLVETLSDDDDDEQSEDEYAYVKEYSNDEFNAKTKKVKNTNDLSAEIYSNKIWEKNKSGRLSVCRKCKRCQETIVNETTCSEAEPFMIPPTSKLPDLNLDILKRLRRLPSLQDMHEYYRRISAEHTFNADHLTLTDSTFNSAGNEINLNKEMLNAELLIANYKSDLKKMEKSIKYKIEEGIQSRATFVHRLKNLLKEDYLKNWIFDYQMQIKNIFIFTNRKIVTTNFVLPYEPTDILGKNLILKNITMSKSRFKEKDWSPVHFIIDFQLKLEFSLILLTLSQENTENAVCNLLKRIGTLCEDIHSLAFRLYRLICMEKAALIREGNNIYVRKLVRTIKTNFGLSWVEKNEFLIEIKNINKICFRDIRKPLLYTFKEEIELLPCGIDFLRIFLSNPLKFVK